MKRGSLAGVSKARPSFTYLYLAPLRKRSAINELLYFDLAEVCTIRFKLAGSRWPMTNDAFVTTIRMATEGAFWEPMEKRQTPGGAASGSQEAQSLAGGS